MIKTETKPTNSSRNWRPFYLHLIKDIGWPLIMILGFFSFLLGTWGFCLYFNPPGACTSDTLFRQTGYNFGDYTYQSFQLYPMNSGGVTPLNNMPLPWQLQTARFTSPLIAAGAFVLWLVSAFRKPIQFFTLRFRRNHIIICGLGRKGYLLAKNFKQQGKTVVVIDQLEEGSLASMAQDLGVIVISGDAREPLVLKKAGIQRAQRLFAVTGDDNANADIALRTREILKKQHNTDLTCTVHIYDTHLWSMLRNRELVSEPNHGPRMEFFNIFDSGAREMLNRCPPFVSSKDPNSIQPHLLVIGLGYLGEALLLHAARDWAALYACSSKKLPVTVIDPQGSTLLKAIYARSPLINTVCNIQSLDFDTHSSDFSIADFLFHPQCCPITHAYICLDDTSAGLIAGLHLLHKSPDNKPRVIVRFTQESTLTALVNSDHDEYKNLETFELLNCTCHPAALKYSTHEHMARAIHNAWFAYICAHGELDTKRPDHCEWTTQKCPPEGNRQASFNQAKSTGRKLKQRNCRAEPWTAYEQIFGNEHFNFTREEIEELAEAEHERWLSEKIPQPFADGRLKLFRRRRRIFDTPWTFHFVPSKNHYYHNSLIDWHSPVMVDLIIANDLETIEKMTVYNPLQGGKAQQTKVKSYYLQKGKQKVRRLRLDNVDQMQIGLRQRINLTVDFFSINDKLEKLPVFDDCHIIQKEITVEGKMHLTFHIYLSEYEKDKDRIPIRNLPDTLRQAGFCIRRLQTKPDILPTNRSA